LARPAKPNRRHHPHQSRSSRRQGQRQQPSKSDRDHRGQGAGTALTMARRVNLVENRVTRIRCVACPPPQPAATNLAPCLTHPTQNIGFLDVVEKFVASPSKVCNRRSALTALTRDPIISPARDSEPRG